MSCYEFCSLRLLRFSNYRKWSPNELRRYLLLLSICGGVLVCYLFWNQPNTPDINIPLYMSTAQKFYAPVSKIDLRWTWTCESQKCVRKEARDGDKRVSLKTCGMLCGFAQIWPQPTGPITLASRSACIHPGQLEYKTLASEPVNSLIQYTFADLNATIYNMVQRGDYACEDGGVEKFVIKASVVNQREVQLKLGSNESYKLVVRMSGNKLVANVAAENFFGVRHGLETLSQLVWWDDYDGCLKVIKGVSMQDAPKFPYRGLMIDTARNFMPVESLKRVLVGMAANKLNAFHWHISDSQSFPLELPRVPQLAKYGAYSPDMVYTVKQVKELVEYARVRGIRVIIEVDVPAHAGNGWTWGPEAGLGDLAVCVNMQPWSLYCGEPPCGQLNPDNPNVYDILEKIFMDLIEMTGEREIFHIGGDEVNLECWSQYRSKKLNNTNIYADLNEVWGNFTLQTLQRLEKANGGEKPKHVVVWSSNLSKRPYCSKYLNASDIIVQTWGGSDWTETPELIASGYQLIISHVDAWYLDCGFGRWRERGEAACDPYRTWQTMYKHQPWVSDAHYRSKVLGGEACLWTEQVDAKSLETRLWPRAAAYAERVWSDPVVDRSMFIGEDVYTRIASQRDRLVRKGLHAEALWPQWCTENPGMCL